MIGQTLGQYRIEEKLGEGGMGVVYRARDKRLQRDVALKLLSAGYCPAAEALDRLLAEARAASALNHPNIASIHEVGEHGGHSFIVMELVPGLPLHRSIPPGGLAPATCLRYATQIASAVAHAHARGVIHRDLKSANVVVTPDGHAKILDFGLARSLPEAELSGVTLSTDALPASDSLAGTLHSMAPEILRGEPADARSDIWALSVLFYQMAAGRLPFEGRTGFELASAIMRHDPPPLPSHIPAGLRAIIQRCLEKEPGHRYAAASQLHAALEAISADSASAAASAASIAAAPTAEPRESRSRKAVLWVVAALALAGLAAWRIPLLRHQPVSSNAPSAPRLSSGGRRSSNEEANETFERAMLSTMVRSDMPHAQQLFERALQLDPKFASARVWRGFFHLLFVHEGISNDRGLLYKAQEDIRQALEDEPDLAAVGHSFLGAVDIYLGRKEIAIGEAQKAIELEQGTRGLSGEVWLGLCFHLSGDYAEARKRYQSLIRRDPFFWPAHWFMTQLLIEEGKLAEARAEAQKVLDQDPANLQVPITLSYGLLTIGDAKGARALLEKVPAKDKDNFRLRLAFALVNASEGKGRRALDPEVLKYAEVNPFVTLSAAEYFALRGDSQNALDWLERAIHNGDERLEWFQRDPLLASIRDLPRFRQFTDAIAFRRQQRHP